MRERIARPRRFPDAVPRGLALFLVASALAKLFKPIMLCGPDPFETANMLMMPVEFFSAVWLWLPGAGRRHAALLMAMVMPAAAAYLVLMDAQGHDVAGCGCFGPVRLQLGAHLLVQAAVYAAATATFLRERERASSRDAGASRHLRRVFD